MPHMLSANPCLNIEVDCPYRVCELKLYCLVQKMGHRWIVHNRVYTVCIKHNKNFCKRYTCNKNKQTVQKLKMHLCKQ